MPHEGEEGSPYSQAAKQGSMKEEEEDEEDEDEDEEDEQVGLGGQKWPSNRARGSW